MGNACQQRFRSIDDKMKTLLPKVKMLSTMSTKCLQRLEYG